MKNKLYFLALSFIFFTFFLYSQTEEPLFLSINDLNRSKIKEHGDLKQWDMNSDVFSPGQVKWIENIVVVDFGSVAVDYETQNELPISTKIFVPGNYFFSKLGSECDTPKKCVINYNPCDNTYKIYNAKGEEESFIRYKYFHKNACCSFCDTCEGKTLSCSCKYACRGGVFRIDNLNMLKYDVSVNSQFVETNTNLEMPSIFSSLANLTNVISGAGGLMHLAEELNEGEKNNEDMIENDILIVFADMLKLKEELKAYLDMILYKDVIDKTFFENQRDSILARIRNSFPTEYDDNDVVSIIPRYKEAKLDFMLANDLDNKKYNEYFKKEFDFNTSPDSLAGETELLVKKLMYTNFFYQYNVIQIQNKDALAFTVDIKPKEGNNGGIYLSKEPLVIPIRGGIKMDFSSGFYYSSVRNHEYTYQNNYINGELESKSIIEENTSKGTLGIAALAHFYPRRGRFSLGPTFGFGASLDLNYSILGGGSLVFGNRHRVMLSGGFNLSNVKRLSASNFINEELPPNVDFSTVNRLETGYFVSFTYTFGLNNTIQTSNQGNKEEDKGKEDESTSK
ncbi:MAG: hypothetical protein MI974_25435 [Chitinophagales bacterium]|nr:hypothetical protein [Chitinophagales bacterium]